MADSKKKRASRSRQQTAKTHKKHSTSDTRFFDREFTKLKTRPFKGVRKL